MQLTAEHRSSFEVAQNRIERAYAMSTDENEIIDAEIVDSDNVPAVILRANSHVSDTPIEAEQGPKTADGRDWPHGPTPDRRCRAHKKTGEQCKNAAILGSTVCRFHGGAAK